MLSHKLARGRPQSLGVETGAEVKTKNVMINGAPWAQLAVKEHSRLKHSKRISILHIRGQVLARFARYQGKGLGPCDFCNRGSREFDLSCQRFNGWILKETLNGKLQAQLPGLSGNLYAADRVSTQLEEI